MFNIHYYNHTKCEFILVTWHEKASTLRGPLLMKVSLCLHLYSFYCWTPFERYFHTSASVNMFVGLPASLCVICWLHDVLYFLYLCTGSMCVARWILFLALFCQNIWVTPPLSFHWINHYKRLLDFSRYTHFSIHFLLLTQDQVVGGTHRIRFF